MKNEMKTNNSIPKDSWVKIARECAEKIVYIHGNLHVNDILPDIKDALTAHNKQIREKLLKLKKSDLGDLMQNTEGAFMPTQVEVITEDTWNDAISAALSLLEE